MKRGRRGPWSWVLPFLGFLALLIVPHAGSGGASANVSDSQVVAPLFSAKSLDGDPVDLESLLRTSKLVVLNFWGVRCLSCIEEIPHLSNISDRYSSVGLRVVGINVDGMDGDALKEMMPKIGVRPSYDLVCDREFKIMDSYGVTLTPHTLAIRPDGKVAYVHIGYSSGDENVLEKAIAGLLGESETVR